MLNGSDKTFFILTEWSKIKQLKNAHNAFSATFCSLLADTESHFIHKVILFTTFGQGHQEGKEYR